MDEQNDNETVFVGEVPGVGAKVKIRQKALPWLFAAFILSGGTTWACDLIDWPPTPKTEATEEAP